MSARKEQPLSRENILTVPHTENLGEFFTRLGGDPSQRKDFLCVDARTADKDVVTKIVPFVRDLLDWQWRSNEADPYVPVVYVVARREENLEYEQPIAVYVVETDDLAGDAAAIAIDAATSGRLNEEINRRAVDGMLPELDSMLILTADQDLRLAFVGEQKKDAAVRKTLLCIDARTLNGPKAQEVIDLADRLLEEAWDEEQDIYVPHIYIVMRDEITVHEPPNAGDIDVMPTEDLTTDVAMIIRETTRADLLGMYAQPNDEGLETKPMPAGEGVPIADLLPADQRDAWNQRMKELELWGRGHPDYESF